MLMLNMEQDVLITPADYNDKDLGEKHKLDFIDIFR